MNKFGEKLRSLRIEAGLTQGELGEKIGYGKTAISNYELNNRTPDADDLVKFADFFDCSLDFLLGRTGFKHGKITEDVIDNEKVKITADEREYPNNLTHEQVLKILIK